MQPMIGTNNSNQNQLSLYIEGQNIALAGKVNVVNKSIAYVSAIAEIRAILRSSNDQSKHIARGRD